MKRIKLFICHAREDKDDFVRPLVKKLETDFEVWYDEYVIKLGDRLRKKIDEGLATCDYGIVVLSHAFFSISKRWPQTELDGLFALEAKRGKVIIPIWKGIDEKGVAGYSPILAGLVAAKDSDGLDSIISQIKLAVGIADRKVAASGVDAAKSRFLSLAQQQATDAAAQSLAGSEEGVRLAEKAVADFCDLLERNFAELQSAQSALQIRIERKQPMHLDIRASYKTALHVRYWNSIVNSIRDARLTLVLHECLDPVWEKNRSGRSFSDDDFSPWFDADKNVVWRLGKDASFTSEELTAKIIHNFADAIDELRKTR